MIGELLLAISCGVFGHIFFEGFQPNYWYGYLISKMLCSYLFDLTLLVCGYADKTNFFVKMKNAAINTRQLVG